MRFFHRTDAADAIIQAGFRDGEGFYMMSIPLCGVFLSDTPLDCDEGTKGDQLLEVTLPDDLDISDYELIEDGKPYREWCVPAQLINDHAAVRLLSPEEAEDAVIERWALKEGDN